VAADDVPEAGKRVDIVPAVGIGEKDSFAFHPDVSGRFMQLPAVERMDQMREIARQQFILRSSHLKSSEGTRSVQFTKKGDHNPRASVSVASGRGGCKGGDEMLAGVLDPRSLAHEDRRMTLSSDHSDALSECDLLRDLRAAHQLLDLVAGVRGNELQLQTKLRREYPDRLVRAAFALCELRRKAGQKFTRADRMWFDRQGFEQATAEAVSLHKARRFSRAVLDLCSGIGGDSIAFARQGCHVTAVDLNPAQGLRTKWNAEAYEVAGNVVTECADAGQFANRTGLVHIDPDRRQQGSGRAVRVEDYVPGLEFLHRLTTEFSGGAIKLSPASNFGGKFPDAEVELVSLHGECKEATIWFGALRGTDDWRATVLPSGETLSGNPLDFLVDQTEVQGFVYDPDPAVVRAGLVDAAAQHLGLARLDREEEYLTGSAPIDSPFVQGFEVLADLSNNSTEIRDWFRTSRAGQVEIKCRHIPIDAEVVRRKLPLPGDEPVTLIFARVSGKSRALVCRRIASEA
jgi:hypothetical protein